MPKISNSLVETLCELSPHDFQQMWNNYNHDPSNVSILGVMADVIDEVMPGNKSAQQLSYACRWAMKNNIIPANNTERMKWKSVRKKLDTPRQIHDAAGNIYTIRYERKEIKKAVGGQVKYWALTAMVTCWPITSRIPEIFWTRGNKFYYSVTTVHRFKNPFRAIEWLGTKLEEILKVVRLED